MPEGFLDSLDPDEQQRVLAACRRRRFGTDEVVFHQGDPGDTLHLVRQGRFAVKCSTPLGDVTTLSLLGTGDCFGELALLDPNSIRTATVVAMEPSETLALHRDIFDELRASNGRINQLLLDLLAGQVRRLTTALLDALYIPVEVRVWRQLLRAAELWGGATPGRVVPLTQEDLAGLAGTTRPTVNGILREGAGAGLISLARGRVVIDRPEDIAVKARGT